MRFIFQTVQEPGKKCFLQLHKLSTRYIWQSPDAMSEERFIFQTVLKSFVKTAMPGRADLQVLTWGVLSIEADQC